jgi:hypothetical protein
VFGGHGLNAGGMAAGSSMKLLDGLRISGRSHSNPAPVPLAPDWMCICHESFK